MQDAVMVNKQLLQPSFNPTVLAKRDCPKAVALSALRGKERVREVWHFSSKFEVLVLTRESGEEARKGRGTGGDQVHPPAFSAFRTSSCLGRRNRTSPVALLAIHTASGHEAECGGSFHGRPQRRLPLYAAVRSAPPPDAAPSAILKREDRLPGVLAPAAAA
jgi:hypothetical protein